MSQRRNFLAIDLGAGNGRVVLGRLEGGRLEMEVAHRFDHAIRFVDGHRRWDWPRIRSGVREGLAEAVGRLGREPVVSVSCSAWAQDFGLIDADGNLIYTPVSYRDARSEAFPDGYFDYLSPEDLVARVGVGAVAVAALCQLYVMAREEPGALRKAATLLHMADLVHHDLCGVAATDWTLATASQLRNPEVAGRVVAEGTLQPSNGDGSMTLGLLVLKAFRDMGIGRRLMIALEVEAHRLDRRRIDLTVWAANDRGYHLYTGMGYREIGRFPDWVRSDLAPGGTGAKVIFTHTGNPRYRDRLDSMLNELEKDGCDVEAVASDARSFEDTDRTVREVLEGRGRIDILVCNVGQNVARPAEEKGEEEWLDAIHINLSSAFYGVRCVLPSMLEAGRGRIVLIGSSAVFDGGGGAIDYAAAKSGMAGMMRYLVRNYARKGITTNVIHPCVIETDLLRERYDDEEKKSALIEQVPVGRLGQPQDIAGLAAFLASSWGDFICGQEILVDGGRTFYRG